MTPWAQKTTEGTSYYTRKGQKIAKKEAKRFFRKVGWTEDRVNGDIKSYNKKVT